MNRSRKARRAAARPPRGGPEAHEMGAPPALLAAALAGLALAVWQGGQGGWGWLRGVLRGLGRGRRSPTGSRSSRCSAIRWACRCRTRPSCRAARRAWPTAWRTSCATISSIPRRWSPGWACSTRRAAWASGWPTRRACDDWVAEGRRWALKAVGPVRRRPHAARDAGAGGGAGAPLEQRRHRGRGADAADPGRPPPRAAGRRPGEDRRLPGRGRGQGARVRADGAPRAQGVAQGDRHGRAGDAGGAHGRRPGRQAQRLGAGRAARRAGPARPPGAPALRRAGWPSSSSACATTRRWSRPSSASRSAPSPIRPCSTTPAQVWNDIKRLLQADLADEHSTLADHVAQAMRDVGDRLRDDDEPARLAQRAPDVGRRPAGRQPARRRHHAHRADDQGLGRPPAGRRARAERRPRPAVHPHQRHGGGRPGRAGAARAAPARCTEPRPLQCRVRRAAPRHTLAVRTCRGASHMGFFAKKGSDQRRSRIVAAGCPPVRGDRRRGRAGRRRHRARLPPGARAGRGPAGVRGRTARDAGAGLARPPHELRAVPRRQHGDGRRCTRAGRTTATRRPGEQLLARAIDSRHADGADSALLVDAGGHVLAREHPSDARGQRPSWRQTLAQALARGDSPPVQHLRPRRAPRCRSGWTSSSRCSRPASRRAAPSCCASIRAARCFPCWPTGRCPARTAESGAVGSRAGDRIVNISEVRHEPGSLGRLSAARGHVRAADRARRARRAAARRGHARPSTTAGNEVLWVRAARWRAPTGGWWPRWTWPRSTRRRGSARVETGCWRRCSRCWARRWPGACGRSGAWCAQPSASATSSASALRALALLEAIAPQRQRRDLREGSRRPLRRSATARRRSVIGRRVDDVLGRDRRGPVRRRDRGAR